MIIYLLGVVVKALFVVVVSLVRTMFGSAWTSVTSKTGSFLALPGVGAGLGLFDVFVGLDFIIWATGLALTIVLTIRCIRLVMGLFSKA